MNEPTAKGPCPCTGDRILVNSSSRIGEGHVEAKRVQICRHCGTVHVSGHIGGVRFSHEFQIWEAQALEAVSKPYVTAREKAGDEPERSWTRRRDPNRYVEDDSRLRTGPAPAHLRHIYEPLAQLITDEDLRPRVWGVKTVTFYPPRQFGEFKVVETTFEFCSDQVLELDGERWSLYGGRCVYHRGQWCMRWTARRVRPPELAIAEPAVARQED